jgi:hypothetical protein
MTWINTAEFDTLRILGALLQDVPPLLAQLVTPGGWLRARNRIETLTPDIQGIGLRCDFEWSSALHVARVFPPTGAWLMHRAFAQWPVRFVPQGAVPPVRHPELSFVIPFRGTERLPQLQATVRSILAQEDVDVECIVIEQSERAESRDALPPAVRHIHLPHPQGDPGWRKSWAYNEAARQARAPVLVCHDGDIVVPAAYGRALLDTLDRGFDSVHIQRFLFYLGAADSQRVIGAGSFASCVPEEVRHNWVGGTLAIRKDAYFAIGGFDERFVDWGGEDNEFFDRCRVLRQCRHGFVPFAHLWHPPQANKNGAGRDAAVAMMNERLAIPPARRIEELRRALAASAEPSTTTR